MTLFRVLRFTVLCFLLAGLEPHLECTASANDVVTQVETALKEAAKDANHGHRDATERAIHDITYLVEQSWKAKERLQDVARKEYATQARALIVREARMGHFDIIKTGPVLKIIEELLAHQEG